MNLVNAPVFLVAAPSFAKAPRIQVVEVKILGLQEKVCTASPTVSSVPFETPSLNTWEPPMPAIYTELPLYTFPM